MACHAGIAKAVEPAMEHIRHGSARIPCELRDLLAVMPGNCLDIADVSAMHPVASMYAARAATEIDTTGSARDPEKRRRYRDCSDIDEGAFVTLTMASYEQLGLRIVQFLSAPTDGATLSAQAGLEVTKAAFTQGAKLGVALVRLEQQLVQGLVCSTNFSGHCC
jgi:type II secretory pathway component PulM